MTESDERSVGDPGMRGDPAGCRLGVVAVATPVDSPTRRCRGGAMATRVEGSRVEPTAERSGHRCVGAAVKAGGVCDQQRRAGRTRRDVMQNDVDVIRRRDGSALGRLRQHSAMGSFSPFAPTPPDREQAIEDGAQHKRNRDADPDPRLQLEEQEPNLGPVAVLDDEDDSGHRQHDEADQRRGDPVATALEILAGVADLVVVIAVVVHGGKLGRTSCLRG